MTCPFISYKSLFSFPFGDSNISTNNHSNISTNQCTFEAQCQSERCQRLPVRVKDAPQVPTPCWSPLPKSMGRAWHPWEHVRLWHFTGGAFVQGATGRGSALGHRVCPSFKPLKMHRSHEAPARAKQLKESNCRDESIHKTQALPEVLLCPRLHSAGGKSRPGQSPQCFY